MGMGTRYVNCCVFTPDGAHLVTGNQSGSLTVWDATTEVEGGAWAPVCMLVGHLEAIWALDVHPTGSYLVSAAEDAMMHLWDTKAWLSPPAWSGPTANGKRYPPALVPSRELRMLDPADEDDPVSCLAFHPGGCRLVTGSCTAGLTVWQCGEWVAERRLQSHTGSINCCTFLPAGDVLVTGGSDLLVRLWDTVGWRPLRTLVSPPPLPIPRRRGDPCLHHGKE